MNLLESKMLPLAFPFEESMQVSKRYADLRDGNAWRNMFIETYLSSLCRSENATMAERIYGEAPSPLLTFS